MSDVKTAFITGAASGIGRAIARQLASEGVSLFITDVDTAGLEALQQELKAKQVNVHATRLDVSDKEAVFATVAEAEAKLGSIDAIFNNAGISFSDMVETMEYEDFERVMDIDFWGVVHGTKAALPNMLKRRSGHIVNISSIFGIIGVPSQTAYCAAKHAVKGFNESLFYELEDTGVQIHSVHPGGVDTNIVRNGEHKKSLSGDIDREEMEQRFEENARSTPEEAAATILKGMRRGKYRILVGGDARFIDRLQRWMPNLWRRIFPRLMPDL